MKYLISISLAALFSFEVLALKPAPFEDHKFTDPDTGITLETKRNKTNDGYGTGGTTTVYSQDGKKLWSMDEFMGRHQMDLSPDGKTMLVTGNFYFTSRINISKDFAVATVYQSGKKIKTVNFSDLFKESVESQVKDRKLPYLGGGWTSITHFVTGIKPDWKAKNLTFTLHGGEVKTIAY